MFFAQGGMWIANDILVNPRKLTTVLAKEAHANGMLFSIAVCSGHIWIFISAKWTKWMAEIMC